MTLVFPPPNATGSGRELAPVASGDPEREPSTTGSAPNVKTEQRRELKYMLPALPSTMAASRLRQRLPALVQEYPHRRVLSIYFDSASYHSFHQSNSGMNARSKLRMRWYGEGTTVIPTLELKHRLSHVGWKRQVALHEMNLEHLSFDQMRDQFLMHALPSEQLLIEMLHRAVVLVSYERHYFRTIDRKLRVTLDTGLRFYDQRNRSRPNLRFDRRDGPVNIVECKGSSEHVTGATRVLAALGARQSRFSKYCYGTALLSGR